MRPWNEPDSIRLGKAPSRQPQGPRCGAHETNKAGNEPQTPPATLVDVVGGGLRERIDRRAAEPRRHNGDTGIGPHGWSWRKANRQKCAQANHPYNNPIGDQPTGGRTSQGPTPNHVWTHTPDVPVTSTIEAHHVEPKASTYTCGQKLRSQPCPRQQQGQAPPDTEATK